MPQFTLRDGLWLTAIVAVLACWAIERHTGEKRTRLLAQRQVQSHIELRELEARLKATEDERAVLQRLLTKSATPGTAK